MIECGQKALAPSVVKEGNSAADQVMPPVAQIGTEKVGTRPMPHGLATRQVITDHLSACPDSGKMTVWTEGKYTTTRRTTVTLQKKAGRISTKVALGVSVAPETIMAAAGTAIWSHPGIFFTQRKNILEKNGNKIYHQ
ncbi:MAG: hypothetical protein WCL71_09135 [Deltaproteobacteria bacterium]